MIDRFHPGFFRKKLLFNMKVPFLDLKKTNREIEDKLTSEFTKFLSSGQYIGGEAVDSFEKEFSSYCGSEYCVGVGNGMDALTLALKSLEIGSGDEVIVPNMTFIATWLSVTTTGADVVGVEPDKNTYTIDINLIEREITDKTKAIVPVHLYGHPAKMDPIKKIASKYDLYVVEDAAQAHGASYKNKKIGSHGDLIAWSFILERIWVLWEMQEPLLQTTRT